MDYTLGDLLVFPYKMQMVLDADEYHKRRRVEFCYTSLAREG
jgi:hypothetical protein